jgi:UDP-glucuronate decarboxylase
MLKSDVVSICERLSLEERSKFDNASILLTGGCGFLGRYFVEVFNELNKSGAVKNCNVLVLDNLITAGKLGQNDISSNYVKFKNCDVSNVSLLNSNSLNTKFDYVIHAAGIASPHYYQQFPLETIDVAINGLKNVCEILKNQGYGKLLHFSSSEIYGNPDSLNVPTSETYCGYVNSMGPRACYDESKRLGETLVQIYHEKYGVKGSLVRPFNVYGPGMQKTDYRVLPNFAACLSDNVSISVYDNGEQTRTFCYITDAMVGFLKVLINGSSGQAYNIGNPFPEISMFDLANKVLKITQKNLKVELKKYPNDYPAGEPSRRCPDIKKAANELGYEPVVSLDDGLKKFFNWSLENF